MGVLRGFERRLEGAVEGMFARAFKSGLQPIELAKAIQRYVEDHRYVTSDGVVVPNNFRVTVNPEDAERLSTYGESLQRELAGVVAATAAKHGWALRGLCRITMNTDDDIAVGRFEMAGRVQESASDDGRTPTPPQGRRSGPPVPPDRSRRTLPATPTPKPRPKPRSTAAATPTQLGQRPTTAGNTRQVDELFGDRATPGRQPEPGNQQPQSRTLRLEVMDTGAKLVLDHARDRLTIGRNADNDLPIESSTVSRRHAALVRRGNNWWVFDLGSTNGTRVNGQRASELPVAPGDRIKVGTIEIQVEET